MFSLFFVTPKYVYNVSKMHYLFIFFIIILVGQLVAKLSDDAKKAKELEISEITKDAILSSLSHELRTPLSAVMGASSTLLDSSLNMNEDTRRELLESIHEGSVKIQNLLENLLNIARLENGKLMPNTTSIEIEELLGTVLGKFSYEVSANISLTINTNKILKCDPSLLELALFNLVENAVKYGTDIRLLVDDEKNCMTIEVSNSTNLNSNSDLNSIFAKFCRLPNSIGSPGIGLGLSICKAIADIHKGKIAAQVTNGRFIIKLIIPWGQQ